MPSYNKSRADLGVARGTPFELKISGTLDANRELPTTASAVEVSSRLSVGGETFRVTKTLDEFSLTGGEKSALRNAADKIKDAAIVSDFGFAKS